MKRFTLTAALLLASTASHLSAQVFTSSYGGAGTRPPASFAMPEFPKFPDASASVSRGQGFAASSSQQFQYSSDGSGLSATYRNASALDVVAQLADLAGLDPTVSEAAWEKLAQARPVNRSFQRVTPREALESLLKDAGLELNQDLGIVARSERKFESKLSGRTLLTAGLEQQLGSAMPLMAFQTPMGMFLQSAALQLGTEIVVDWRTLRLDPQTPVNIPPFKAATLGDSLRLGLASAGLEYRIEAGRIVVSRLAD